MTRIFLFLMLFIGKFMNCKEQNTIIKKKKKTEGKKKE